MTTVSQGNTFFCLADLAKLLHMRWFETYRRGEIGELVAGDCAEVILILLCFVSSPCDSANTPMHACPRSGHASLFASRWMLGHTQSTEGWLIQDAPCLGKDASHRTLNAGFVWFPCRGASWAIDDHVQFNRPLRHSGRVVLPLPPLQSHPPFPPHNTPPHTHPST